MGYCTAHDWLHKDKGFLKELKIIHNADIQAYVADIPRIDDKKHQIQFNITKLNQKNVSTTALLNCYKNCPNFNVGDYFEFKAKLKRPVNLNNPGGFDYVSWLSSRHVWWVGNIKPGTIKIIKEKHAWLFFSKIREYFGKKIEELMPEKATVGIFQALTVGLTHHIPKSDWDLFRRTGTTHLIDISGEHIAIVIAFIYLVLQLILTNIRTLPLNIPMQTIKGIGAIIAGLIYAGVSGFSVPTQRALISALFMLLHTFFYKKLTIWQAWRYALLIVLLLEPHSVFMLGFYFSFIAVAILILINERFKYKGVLKVCVIQVACLFGLMPLSLYWFSYASISSLLANLIAIPLVGFVIVPMSLIILFLSPILVIPYSVNILNFFIKLLLKILIYVDSFSFVNLTFNFNRALEPMCIMFAMLVLVFLPLKRIKPIACLLIIVCFFPHAPKIRETNAQIDVLDVGQGLSVIVRTKNHTLVYDTGVKFHQGSDMGRLVLIPYLGRLGIKSLDMVVISHADLDHRGGLESLSEVFNIDKFVVDDPKYYNQGVSCHDYPSWIWDGVKFEFFAIKEKFKGKNNNSCVLKVTNNKGAFLLTGDIEKPAELYLIKHYDDLLSANVLLIPHHESKTSSSIEFLTTVQPDYAIASYGFDNRYHFPHIKPKLRYEQLDIPVFNTCDNGMISVSLNNILQPKTYL